MDGQHERWCPACRHTQAYGEFCQTCGGRLTTEPRKRRSNLLDPGMGWQVQEPRGSSAHRSKGPGFWGGFFDPSFTSTVAPPVTKVIWIAAIVLTALGMLWAVSAIITLSPYLGPLEVVVILIGGPLNLFLLRLLLEVAQAVLQIRNVRLAGTTGEER